MGVGVKGGWVVGIVSVGDGAVLTELVLRGQMSSRMICKQVLGVSVNDRDQ